MYEPVWKEDRVDPNKPVVTTAAGEVMTYGEACLMAWLVHKRFGRNTALATEGWQRMMQNSTTEADFQKLVDDHQKLTKQIMLQAAYAKMDAALQHGGRPQ